MSSEDTKRLTPNRLRLLPREVNSLIAESSQVLHADEWSSIKSSSGISNVPDLQIPEPVHVKAEVNLEPFSVFYAKTGWGQNLVCASGYSEATDTNLPYRFYLTTTTGCQAGNSLEASVIGTHFPHRVKYTDVGGVPYFGATLGCVPGTYKVGLGYDGLLAVSDPNTDDETIWVIRSFEGNKIRLIQLAETLHPGTAANGFFVDQVDGDWSVGDACIIQDVSHRNFGLEDELLWGVRTGETNDGVQVYEAIGENGLEQHGYTNANVSCGNTANFVVKHGGATKDVDDVDLTISDKEADDYLADRKLLKSTGACGGGTSGPTVSACATALFSRKVFAGEFVRLKYSTANRRWEYLPIPAVLSVKATLTSDLCDNSEHEGDVSAILGGECTPFSINDPQIFRNELNRQTKTGNIVYATFNGVDKFDIFAVQAETKTELTDIAWDADLCQFDLEYQTKAIETCQDPDVDTLQIGVEQQVCIGFNQGTSGSGGDCAEITPVYKTVRVLCAGDSTPGDNPLVLYEEQAFLIDIYYSGGTIYGTWMTIQVPSCYNALYDDVLFETENCDTSGSGSSGSGSG